METSVPPFASFPKQMDDHASAHIHENIDQPFTGKAVSPMHSFTHGATKPQEQQQETAANSKNNVRFAGPLPSTAFPEIDEVVMVRVLRVTEAGLLVRILEFNAEGFVPAEEVSARRKKTFSPTATFRVGKELPAKVTAVDTQSGYIDLSLKAVNAVESRECARARVQNDAATSLNAKVAARAGRKVCGTPQAAAPSAVADEESEVDAEVVDTLKTDKFLQCEIAALLQQARASTLDSKCVQDSVRLEILSLKNELNVPVADCAIALLKAVITQAVGDLRSHTASPPKNIKKVPTLATFLARGIAEWAGVLAKLCATPDGALELLLWAAEFFDSGSTTHTQTPGQHRELTPALFAVLLFQLYDKEVIVDESVFRRWRDWCLHDNVFAALLRESESFFHWLDTADEE